MSLGSDIAATLPFLREQAASRFTETFDFFTEADGTDPVTLRPIIVEAAVTSGVAGRMRFTDTQGEDAESGGQFPVKARQEVHVGVGAVVALPGVMVRIVGSTADPSLVGRRFRISDRAQGGQVTAARYPVEEVT